jgi:hypothetical protein
MARKGALPATRVPDCLTLRQLAHVLAHVDALGDRSPIALTSRPQLHGKGGVGVR